MYAAMAPPRPYSPTWLLFMVPPVMMNFAFSCRLTAPPPPERAVALLASNVPPDMVTVDAPFAYSPPPWLDVDEDEPEVLYDWLPVIKAVPLIVTVASPTDMPAP